MNSRVAPPPSTSPACGGGHGWGRFSLFAGVAALGLAACSIEGTGDGQASIEGTGYTEGSATGFGSVFVNGVEWDTSEAEIIINGVPATESALKVGMVLAVTGRFTATNRGVAERIEADQLLLAPVEEILSGKRLAFLRQDVRFDEATVFENATAEALQPGTVCAVWGFPRRSGASLASLIECSGEPYVAGATMVEVEGEVRDLEDNGFFIGDLSVDITAAQINPTAGALRNGARVEVIGVQPDAGGALRAQRVRIETPRPPRPRERLRVQGLIADFQGLQNFTVNGLPVDASNAKRRDKTGLEPADGVHITLRGRASEDGVVVARRYKLLPPAATEYAARVDTVDEAAVSFAVFGLTIRTGETTLFDDKSSAHLRTFGLADLRAGDYVEASVYAQADGSRIAGSVVRRNPENESGISGAVESFDSAQRSIRLAGVSVLTGGGTAFRGRNGGSVDAPTFFGDLRTGDLLEATGSESADTLQAAEIRYAR